MGKTHTGQHSLSWASSSTFVHYTASRKCEAVLFLDEETTALQGELYREYACMQKTAFRV
jgi:hypothetical protein